MGSVGIEGINSEDIVGKSVVKTESSGGNTASNKENTLEKDCSSEVLNLTIEVSSCWMSPISCISDWCHKVNWIFLEC